MEALILRTPQAVQLDKSLFLTANKSLIDPSAPELRDELVESSKNIEVIRSPAAQQLAADMLVKIQAMLSASEKQRTVLKAPYIDFGKRIDKDVKDFTASLEKEKTRLKTMMAEFSHVLAQKAAAEQAAQAKAMTEVQDKIEHAETTGAKPAAMEALRREQEQLLNPIEIPKAAGVNIRSVNKFRVTDIDALYKARPDLCRIEPKALEINKLINDPSICSLVIAGIEIYPEVAVSTGTKH